MKTAGIVLAAGRSNRFGPSDKLLANFNGKPLASYAANTVRELDLDMKIAMISNQEIASIFHGFRILNVSGQQSDSLREGVMLAQRENVDRVLIILADMPFINSEIIAKLLKIEADVAALETSFGRKSVPAVFRLEQFQKLTELKGDIGARDILKKSKTVETLIVPDEFLLDIDTQEDLKRRRNFKHVCH